jgi:hypothetical protein
VTDTWEWDGANWTQLFPAGNPNLGPITYDIRRGRVVVYGGGLGGGTWEFDGVNWISQPSANLPPFRLAHGMVYDLARGRVVMFGGELLGSSTNEVWEWDGSDWTQRSPSVSVDGRQSLPLAYDTSRERVVLFSGLRLFQPIFSDTWEYYSLAPADYRPFGTGCSGSAGSPVLGNRTLSLPWLDDTLMVDVENVASGAPVFLAAGLSNASWQGTPLPFSLTPYGMPGCSALVSVDALAFTLATGTVASFSISICNCPPLLGATFHNQAIALGPGNPAVSNGATGVVGQK